MDNDHIAYCSTYMHELSVKTHNRFRYFVFMHDLVNLGVKSRFLSPYYVIDYFQRIIYDSQTAYEALEYYTYM